MAPVLQRVPLPKAVGVIDPYSLVGEVVAGRFRVLSVRHVGPRGLVYEVEPPGVGQMRRALKIRTLPEAREPDIAERMRNVVRRFRDIDHPHAERVFDLGTLPDDAPFVVAEWLPYATLEARLSHRRPLPTETAIALLLRVCRAVAAFHAKGLTHGDIRPSHILIDLRGDEPADLILVKLIDGVLPSIIDAAPAGGAFGQVAYLAPECLAGALRSPSSDVYALGVMAYRLLSHILPYRPDDPRAAAFDRDPVSRVRWLHQHASPVRPSRLSQRPEFPPALEQVIGRALSKSVADRPADAGALLGAIEAALASPLPTFAGQIAVPVFEGETSPREVFASVVTKGPPRAEGVPSPPQVEVVSNGVVVSIGEAEKRALRRVLAVAAAGVLSGIVAALVF